MTVNILPTYYNLISSLGALYEYDEIREWRYAYNGGHLFRAEYLERYGDSDSPTRESKTEFDRRKRLTPIPTFAKAAVHRVRNALAQGLTDVERRGGLKMWLQILAGELGGVNRHGMSMDAFIVQELLAEMLVMARVGVVVDAPAVPSGASQADVPASFGPYLNAYRREDYRAWPSEPGARSEFKAAVVRDRTIDFKVETATETETVTYRYYEIVPGRGNLVNVTRLDEAGKELEVTETELDEIPLVSFDIKQSLMQDAASHQITLLNLTSSDSASGIDTNHPILLRQRGQDHAGAHLIGADAEVTTGTRRGLWYDRGADAPSYISAPTGSIATSISLRDTLKQEIDQMVLSSLTALGEDGSPEAGLHFIGSVLASGEMKIWRYWNTYKRIFRGAGAITVTYPDTWNIKTDAERAEESDQILSVGRKFPGREPQKTAIRLAAHKFFHGKVSPDELTKILKSIEDSPFTIADPEMTVKLKDSGLVSADTGAQAVGYMPGEADKAKKDQAERAAAIVAAQSDARDGAARGAPDMSADPQANRLAREGERDTSADLDDRRPGVRGEGR
jgi:hypothetical protein